MIEDFNSFEAQRPEHSPLGASSAERWMKCPGSVALLKKLILPESDEPDYRKEGTAAHELAAKCLREGRDGWEFIGEKFGNDVEITLEIADGVQIYLNTVRALITKDTEVFIEFGISAPVHPLFYGTVDCGITDGSTLFVTDYKNGAGVVVDVEENPQMMYYAYGLLLHFPDVVDVELRIVQPNAFHYDGPVRLWKTTAAHIHEWVEKELVPAMLRTEFDDTLDAGKWCRFCPAKLVCPLMNSLFGAVAKTQPKIVKELTDDRLGRDYQYIEAAKQFIKALELETYRRLNLGTVVPGTKLVNKKANRIFKDGADKLAVKMFGKQAYTKPGLKSPAGIDGLGVAGKQFTREHAYTPQTGLTVAVEDDKRPGVKVQSQQEIFARTIEKLQGGNDEG